MCISKVLLEHSCAHPLHSVCGWFWSIKQNRVVTETIWIAKPKTCMILSFTEKVYRPLSWSSVREAAMEPTPSPFRPQHGPSPLYSVPLPCTPHPDHTAQPPPMQKCLIRASLWAALTPTFYTCFTFTLEHSCVFLHIYFY